MAQLSYTELKPGTVFVKDKEPFLVLEYKFVRMQAQKPTVQLKTKNLLSGKVNQLSVQPSESFEEAEIKRTPVIFIYSRQNEYWFHKKDNKGDRFSLKEEIIGPAASFLKNGLEVTSIEFDDKVVSIEAPIKVDLEVTEAPPAVKGNTAQGGTKTVTLETGFKINAPLFIQTGDIVRINTSNGQYVERAEKKS
jgi:elongation factor P